LDTNLKECIICGSVDGESKDGVLVRLDGDVCNVCREMIPKLAEKYRIDFQQRLGQKITDVVPYPLFKIPHFTFPPYSEVYNASSYMDTSPTRFAVGLAEDCLVGGRRSHQSIAAELEQEAEDIENKLEGGVPGDEEEILKFRKRQIESLLERRKKAKKKMVDMKFGYRPDEEDETDDRYKHIRLFTIPYRDLDTPILKDRGDWIRVSIPYRKLDVGFFGGKKWKMDKVYWIISRTARPFLDELGRRIEDADRS
jgi:hypothetical protein